MKKLLCVILALFTICAVLPFSASAISYTYNVQEEAQLMSDAVTVESYVDWFYAGCPEWNEPTDIATDSDGKVYICDAAGNNVIVLDSKFRFIKSIETLKISEGSDKLVSPQGVYVDEYKNIYIADRGNNRVIVCNIDGVVSRVITVDAKKVYLENFVFEPLKVAADKWGNTYVLAKNVYEGLLQFDSADNFIGFVGSNEVKPSIIDILWKKIATKKQREQYTKTVPVEFDNIDIDADGFVYTVTASISNSPESAENVRKQTAKGSNILKTSELFGNVVGDFEFPLTWDVKATVKGSSAFKDVSASQSYGFSCLDSNHGRVFVYNENSDLLFAFGGIGTVEGTFQKPVAITSYEDKIMVLDSQTKGITVFEFTDYGSSILEAQQSYIDGDYKESEKRWKAVLTQNSNLAIAYAGLAKTYIMQGEYSDAMYYAKLGNDQTTYSKAFKFYRQEQLSKYFFPLIVAVAVLAVVAVIAVYLLKKRKANKISAPSPVLSGLKFSGFVMTHPFKGFWDMSHERKGNIVSVIIIYAIYVLVSICSEQYSAFLFTDVRKEFNLITALCTAIVPVLLWCVCNWSVTTLTDGDGKPVEIAMATAYALVPFVLFTAISIPLTYVFTKEEAMFITIIKLFGIVWTAFLLLVSNITVHDFTLPKAIGTIVITIVGILIVIFLALLVFNLVQQMAYFIISIYNQLVIRL